MTPNEKPASPTQKALQQLANEVGGLIAFEPEVRQAIGHMNWNVLMLRLAEADTLLSHTPAQSVQTPAPDEAVRSGLVAARSVVEALIGHEYNVETWDLRSRLAAIDAALAALDRTTLPPTWQPTHKHVKRGSEYRLDGYGEVQTDTPLADYAKVAIYRAEDGTTWVRPVSEFEDGRFEVLASKAGAA